MGRSTKQFLYGLSFIVILGLIGVGIYSIYLKPTPSCNDGILNQNEEQIDCGGLCINCELRDLELIKSEVQIINLGENKSAVVASIRNPSLSYGVGNLRYSFDIRSIIGGHLQLLEGTTSVLSGETRYVIEAGIPIKASDVGEIQFQLEEDIDFRPADEFLDYDILVRQVKIDSLEDFTEVTGVITNNSGFNINILKLVALIYNKDSLVSVGTTVIDSINAFSSKDFLIFLPKMEEFVDQSLDVKVFAEVIS